MRVMGAPRKLSVPLLASAMARLAVAPSRTQERLPASAEKRRASMPLGLFGPRPEKTGGPTGPPFAFVLGAAVPAVVLLVIAYNMAERGGGLRPFHVFWAGVLCFLVPAAIFLLVHGWRASRAPGRRRGARRLPVPAEAAAQPEQARVLRRARPLAAVRAHPPHRGALPAEPDRALRAVLPGPARADGDAAGRDGPVDVGDRHGHPRGQPRDRPDRGLQARRDDRRQRPHGGHRRAGLRAEPELHVLRQPVRLRVAGHRVLHLGAGGRRRGPARRAAAGPARLARRGRPVRDHLHVHPPPDVVLPGRLAGRHHHRRADQDGDPQGAGPHVGAGARPDGDRGGLLGLLAPDRRAGRRRLPVAEAPRRSHRDRPPPAPLAGVAPALRPEPDAVLRAPRGVPDTRSGRLRRTVRPVRPAPAAAGLLRSRRHRPHRAHLLPVDPVHPHAGRRRGRAPLLGVHVRRPEHRRRRRPRLGDGPRAPLARPGASRPRGRREHAGRHRDRQRLDGPERRVSLPGTVRVRLGRQGPVRRAARGEGLVPRHPGRRAARGRGP